MLEALVRVIGAALLHDEEALARQKASGRADDDTGCGVWRATLEWVVHEYLALWNSDITPALDVDKMIAQMPEETQQARARAARALALVSDLAEKCALSPAPGHLRRGRGPARNVEQGSRDLSEGRAQRGRRHAPAEARAHVQAEAARLRGGLPVQRHRVAADLLSEEGRGPRRRVRGVIRLNELSLFYKSHNPSRRGYEL